MSPTVAAVLAEVRYPDAVQRAEQLLESVCCEFPRARPSVYDVAKHLGLPIRSARRWVVKGHEARIKMIAGRDTILIRGGLLAEREAFVIGHEIAHYILGEHHGMDMARLERWCDEFGATLVSLHTPRLAV